MFTGAIDNNKTEQMVESLGESRDLNDLNENIKKIFESFDVDIPNQPEEACFMI